MALTEDFTKPDFVDLASDLQSIRDNFNFIITAAANGSIVIPGWSTTVNSTSSPVDYNEPDNVTLTHTSTASPQVTRQIVIEYTWTSGNVTQMVVKFDDGTGLVTVTGGTLSLTYDGSNNFTGATSA